MNHTTDQNADESKDFISRIKIRFNLIMFFILIDLCALLTAFIMPIKTEYENMLRCTELLATEKQTLR